MSAFTNDAPALGGVENSHTRESDPFADLLDLLINSDDDSGGGGGSLNTTLGSDAHLLAGGARQSAA